jgi:poly(3-hydroxybutyrate) depolymerase
MAVQMGVAHSAAVKGVAATAGGPYFCALDAALGGNDSSTAIARCMQGDPLYGVRPITTGNLDQMEKTARDWAAAGKIDPVSNLAKQAVWVFHGYNDGIVKRPVSQALIDWYGRFTPSNQIFHKDTLNAAHAQISTACSSTGANNCNTCPTTGNKFINACADQPAVSGQLYDAAGTALQWFYGPLSRTDSAKLGTQAQPFSQLPYLKSRGGKAAAKPDDIAMGETGYVYIPQACQQGQPCRLHIAFHGCSQSATSIGMDFVNGAGVNEWADANHIVVLYPQAKPTLAAVGPVPTNPMGCWDWWGYNDRQDLTTLGAKAGYYATKDGVQIAAVWRMVEQLAAKGQAQTPAKASAAAPRALDQSANQIVLRWQEVSNATAYRVYRAAPGQAASAVGQAVSQPFLVDGGLSPSTRYTYTVRPVVKGKEGKDSAPASTTTARQPTQHCDPYFSLTLNTPVKKVSYPPFALPTSDVCP